MSKCLKTSQNTGLLHCTAAVVMRTAVGYRKEYKTSQVIWVSLPLEVTHVCIAVAIAWKVSAGLVLALTVVRRR